MIELEQHIKDKINNHTYVVDQKLIDHLSAEYKKGTYSKRENVDAIAMEETMKWKGIAKQDKPVPGEAYAWRHDDMIEVFSPNIYYIDYKRKGHQYKNISLTKKHQMIESYNINQLTHIVAYKTNIDIITPNEIGKTLTFKYLGIWTVKQAWNESSAPVETYRLLNVE